MPVRSARAEWKGSLVDGSGQLGTESGALSGVDYNFPSRFESGSQTNPEELIAAAHAGCYSMALSNGLAKAGHPPESVQTEARVTLEKVEGGFAITGIELICRARVPGIDASTFGEHAQAAKTGCPVSKALSAVEIDLDAALEG
jgi:osmotically inducible protein OsmC